MTASSRASDRTRLRALRRALPRPLQSAAARRVAARLMALPWLRRARRVALYCPNDGEMGIRPLLTRLSARGTMVYLPVLTRWPRRSLRFARWQPGAVLQPNRLGIAEPARGTAMPLRARGLDVIVVPLVGFTHAGGRLGRGGGFYDRTLAFRHQGGRWRRPRLIGIAYEIQHLPSLATTRFDVTLDAVVTEAGIYLARDVEPAHWTEG